MFCLVDWLDAEYTKFYVSAGAFEASGRFYYAPQFEMTKSLVSRHDYYIATRVAFPV